MVDVLARHPKVVGKGDSGQGHRAETSVGNRGCIHDHSKGLDLIGHGALSRDSVYSILPRPARLRKSVPRGIRSDSLTARERWGEDRQCRHVQKPQRGGELPAMLRFLIVRTLENEPKRALTGLHCARFRTLNRQRRTTSHIQRVADHRGILGEPLRQIQRNRRGVLGIHRQINGGQVIAQRSL